MRVFALSARSFKLGAAFSMAACFATLAGQPVRANVSTDVGGLSVELTAERQAIAEAVAGDKQLASFYRDRNFAPLFTSNDTAAKARLQALIDALNAAPSHGLAPYDGALLGLELGDITSYRAAGQADIALAKLYLSYARDIEKGQLVPARIDEGLVRKISYRGARSLLDGIATDDPQAFLTSLIPSTSEYLRLRREMLRLEDVVLDGGWGATVGGTKLEPGQSGPNIVALRDRLIAMGYLERSIGGSFDTALLEAVRSFQLHHGLTPDGVAGEGTLAELNVPAHKRLQSVLVALERERWTNFERGPRHIWVNLTDFKAKVVDDGVVTFETRSVVGANDSDRRSPEFSDVMEHMVINPRWNVPRSITVKEYLPQLQQNPNAVSHLRILDRNGQTVSRGAVDFNQYSADTFPFSMRQDPSNSNALGLVKFMFPNKHNIYLHDTPAKNLFSREVRAFSHGCIRLHQPFDFAYALLAKQSDNPVGVFQSHLKTGTETQLQLKEHVPVHIVYRTAVSLPKGGMEYRRDIYGRDAKIWAALEAQGVELPRAPQLARARQ